jgi:hypothetical protein
MTVHSSGNVLLALTIALLLLPLVSVPAARAEPSPASPLGVLIPLYTYPGPTWDTVVALKQANPGVTMVVVVNPSNGPGPSQDPNYVSGVKKLQSAGVTVIGYVYTSFGTRNVSLVEADVRAFANWYGVTGVFFDEMSNTVGNEGYYRSLTQYARSLGLQFTVGNPGADVPSSYIGTVNTMVIYESQGLPSQSFLAGWHANFNRTDFATISYGMPSLDPSFVASMSGYVGYVYVTDGNLPNPYGQLPSYLGALVSAIQASIGQSSTVASGGSAGSSTTSSTTTSTSSSSTVSSSSSAATSTGTIRSGPVGPSGNPLATRWNTHPYPV